MATWRYKLLFSCGKIFHLFPLLAHEIFCNTRKRNFVSLRSYRISSIPTDMEKRSLVVTLHSLHCVLNLMFTVISSHDQCDEQTRLDLPQANVTSFTAKCCTMSRVSFFEAAE